MIDSNLKRFVTGNRMTKWALAGAAAIVLSVPAVSQAADYRSDRHEQHRHDERRHDDRRYDDRRRDDHRHDEHRNHDHETRARVNVQLNLGRFQPERRVWVAPVYRTVSDRRWCEPVYKTVCEQVLVPAVHQDREIVFFERGRRCTRIERVCVTPARYETRDRQVCVSEGHWDTIERQELVSDGHWDYR